MNYRISNFMALYNTIIAGGFGVFILLLFFFPGLKNTVLWHSLDAAAASLLVPLFVTLGGYTFYFRKQPEKLRPVFIIQLIYKPFALLLLAVFFILGEIHLLWTILIGLALIVYLIGHSAAVKS